MQLYPCLAGVCGSRREDRTPTGDSRWDHHHGEQWVFKTHWGRDEMAAISQKTLSMHLFWIKRYGSRLLFRLQWRLFLRVHLIIFQHWFRKWLGAEQATSHYLNQWWLDFRRTYASPGLNELMVDTLMTEFGRPYFKSYFVRTLYFKWNCNEIRYLIGNWQHVSLVLGNDLMRKCDRPSPEQLLILFTDAYACLMRCGFQRVFCHSQPLLCWLLYHRSWNWKTCFKCSCHPAIFHG